jgi:DNA-binding transcriptional ArsR family regulator
MAAAPAQKIDFVASVPLDLMNAMYFTSLIPDTEGVDGWPEQVRGRMQPDLLSELDALYNYPAGDPGLMGILGENLFARPELWGDIASLLTYVRDMPLGIGDTMGSHAGVQGLIYQTTFRYLEEPDRQPYAGLPPREAIERRLGSLDDRDAGAIMTLYDRPDELRSRMGSLIERFYEEQYQQEMPRRLACLERSTAAHRRHPITDVADLARKLTGRPSSCLELDVCPGPYDRYVFAPSLDMGPYASCTVIGGVHGLFYPCEPEYRDLPQEEADVTRLARIYKALGDEQRLRILRMLREREMYAQEIVERTGLHQSVVSRHLMFMKAVGLVEARRKNNMKFYSLNSAMAEELGKTLELFTPAVPV